MNNNWYPRFVHTLSTLKEISPGPGPVGPVLHIRILVFAGLVRNDVLLVLESGVGLWWQRWVGGEEGQGAIWHLGCLCVWECVGRTSL